MPKRLLLWWFSLLLGILIVLQVLTYTTLAKTSQTGSQSLSEPSTVREQPIEKPTIEENSYVAPKIQFVPPLENKSLVNCLISYESKGNPRAYNPRDTDGLPKYGILQFGKATFQEFCVQRYQMENNIWDHRIQKQCADKMIRDGYLYRWGTADKCY